MNGDFESIPSYWEITEAIKHPCKTLQRSQRCMSDIITILRPLLAEHLKSPNLKGILNSCPLLNMSIIQAQKVIYTQLNIFPVSS